MGLSSDRSHDDRERYSMLARVRAGSRQEAEHSRKLPPETGLAVNSRPEEVQSQKTRTAGRMARGASENAPISRATPAWPRRGAKFAKECRG